MCKMFLFINNLGCIRSIYYSYKVYMLNIVDK